MELHSDRINFNDLFDELAAKWASVVAESGNRFKVEPAPATEIICDAPKLRRVIENLLSNAAKFTKGGCILLTASIEAGTLTVVVEDSGVGIAESEIEGLFETFGNSDQETASNYGDDVRLGLPLAHRYCRLMGGELSVKSKLGLGSRFILRVPVQLVADQIKMPSEKQTMGRAA